MHQHSTYLRFPDVKARAAGRAGESPHTAVSAAKKGSSMKTKVGLLGRFNNLSIATKLAVCFGTLVVGLVVVIVVGSSGMSSMNAVHTDVVNVGEAKAL